MIALDEVTPVVQALDKELVRCAEGLLMKRTARSPYPEDQADVDFLITRVGRMHQFLKATYILAAQNFGSAAAPIARAMWETWIDTAWLLLNPGERAELFWRSAGPEYLGLFDLYEQHEELNDINKKVKSDILDTIVREPDRYKPWQTKNGSFVNFRQFYWRGSGISIGKVIQELEGHGRLGEPGQRPYRHSYDYVYSRLCSTAHGDAMELDSLMADLPDGAATFFTGAGPFDALSALLSGSGASLTFLAEIHVAGYHLGDIALFKQLRTALTTLREKHGS